MNKSYIISILTGCLLAFLLCACEKAPNGLEGSWVLESSELLPQTVIGFETPVETIFKYKGDATYTLKSGVLTISGEMLASNLQYTYTSDGSVLFIDTKSGQKKYSIAKVNEERLTLKSAYMLCFTRK